MFKNSSKVSIRIYRECFFGPDLAKKGFWGNNFENITPDLESAFPRYHFVQIFRQNGQF